jgi:hypothetical protein
MTQEQQSPASSALLGELIKIIRREKVPGGNVMTFAAEKTFTLEGIRIPDTRLAREITQFVRDTESGLLFHHSSRVYYWGALAGKRRGLKFDHELLYAGAMFHDMGLTPAHTSAHERFEVDGANAARDFLSSHSIGQDDIYGEYSDAEREAVVHAHPHSELFKEDIIQAFYVKADVLADKDPAFRRGNFCSVIRGSTWRG